jgi:hypothetical protein
VSSTICDSFISYVVLKVDKRLAISSRFTSKVFAVLYRGTLPLTHTPHFGIDFRVIQAHSCCATERSTGAAIAAAIDALCFILRQELGFAECATR